MDDLRFTEGPPGLFLGPLNRWEQENAPDLLFLAGDPGLLGRSVLKVSIVGSRAASPGGLRRAAKLSAWLAKEHGVAIVSGLAKGIDTAAHEAAIQAGGRTIAVLGTPLTLSRSYPAENRALQERIMREHLAVSQFPEGMRTGRWCFPKRNRTMALLSDATVIVEASDTSGSLSQGWEALRLNRRLFLMRSVVEREDLEWPARMLDHGAEVLAEPEDILPALVPADPIALAL